MKIFLIAHKYFLSNENIPYQMKISLWNYFFKIKFCYILPHDEPRETAIVPNSSQPKSHHMLKTDKFSIRDLWKI